MQLRVDQALNECVIRDVKNDALVAHVINREMYGRDMQGNAMWRPLPRDRWEVRLASAGMLLPDLTAILAAMPAE